MIPEDEMAVSGKRDSCLAYVLLFLCRKRRDTHVSRLTCFVSRVLSSCEHLAAKDPDYESGNEADEDAEFIIFAMTSDVVNTGIPLISCR